MYVEPGEVYVRCVRAVSDERDALALRLRLTGLLAQANLHPSGLPRSAVFFVRRLRAPGAGALALGRSGAAAQGAWADACAETVARLLSSAARPAHGFVPAAAESVLFRDRAEMLACLAADWCSGHAQARWWWRSLFKQAEVTGGLLAAWRAAPEYVPGALAHLARRGLARDFARALPAGAARTLLDEVVRRFALRELAVALSHARREPSATSGPTHHRVGAAINETAPTARTHAAPWRHVAPEAVGASLDIDAACLLGVGLTLARAPAAARAESLAKAVREWLLADHQPPGEQRTEGEVWKGVPRPPLTDVEESDAPTPLAPPTPTRERSTTGARDRGEARLPGDDQPALRAPADVDKRGTDARLDPSRLEASEQAREAVGESGIAEARGEVESQTRSDDLVVNDALSLESGLVQTPPAETEVWRTEGIARAEAEVVAETGVEFAETFEGLPGFYEAPDALPLEAQIETRFGGLFFLINLGLYLELYADFSAPLQPGLALSIWDFCALLGEKLCGRGLRDDPVWPLLARLAGREAGAEPGMGFDAPGQFRALPEWLSPLPRGGVWRWTSARGRLRVVHAQGFVVLDVARDNRDPGAQLAAELEAYADVYEGTLRRDGRLSRARGRTPLARWVTWLGGYARVRLCRALGCKAGGLRALLFAHAARVTVTATHLDVFMALAELPVEARLAGLDRDPGWTPSAGRHIAFHFD